MKYEIFTNADKSFKTMSKKLLFSLFLTLSVSLSVVGQISFLGSTGHMIFKNNTHNSGELFFEGNWDFYNTFNGTPTTGFQINLYDPNLSFLRTITVPIGYSVIIPSVSNQQLFGPILSDNLFNSDNLLEYLCLKKIGSGISSGNDIYLLNVLNEQGTILFTFPDTLSNSSRNVSISKSNNNFILSIKTCTQTNGYITESVTKTYSLPGTLPCNQCNYISGIVEPNTGGGLGEMKVYPNPFNNTLQVNYDFPTNQSNPRLVLTDILGRELREIKLTSQTDNVSINTTDLPKGTIIVSLYGGQNMISKKVIKID